MADGRVVPHVYPEGCFFKTVNDIKDKHITVMGLGLNGGGEACVKFLLKHGAYVTVTDMKSRQDLEPTILSITSDVNLDRSRLTYVLGEHRIEDFANADCVIKNPGVRYEGNKYLAVAKAIETDLSMFLTFSKAPIIAVTGSKGKSSTASAIYYGLQKAGYNAFLGGNITVSPLTFLDQTDGTTPVILELSSWQLRDLRGRKVLKPKISIITKIMPDHQNWYGDMDSYVDDKRLIYADQTPSDYAIIDYDNDGYDIECGRKKNGCRCWGDDFASDCSATVFRYSAYDIHEDFYGAYLKKERDGIIYGYANLPDALKSRRSRLAALGDEKIMKELAVPGPIMRINVLKAALALRLMGVNPEQTADLLGDWPGLAYRMELIQKWKSQKDGRLISFYNDSCSTVPQAAAAATQSFKQEVVLIAGGTDKNLDFLPLARALTGEDGSRYRVKQLYLLAGTGSDKLISLLNARHFKYYGPFDSLEDLLYDFKENVLSSTAKAELGPVSMRTYLPVVFSPGCTSFGMFSNEFDRGDKFNDLVRRFFI